MVTFEMESTGTLGGGLGQPMAAANWIQSYVPATTALFVLFFEHVSVCAGVPATSFLLSTLMIFSAANPMTSYLSILLVNQTAATVTIDASKTMIALKPSSPVVKLKCHSGEIGNEVTC